eukprot:195831_1
MLSHFKSEIQVLYLFSSVTTVTTHHIFLSLSLCFSEAVNSASKNKMISHNSWLVFMVTICIINGSSQCDSKTHEQLTTHYSDHILPILDTEIMVKVHEVEHSYDNHPGFKHWFWDYMSLGQYSLEQLRQYALMYYQHVRVFRLYLAGAMTVIDNEGLQRALSETIADEYGISLYGESLCKKGHPQLFRDFMISLNLTETEWGTHWKNNKYLIEGIEHYKQVHYGLFKGDLKYEMIGAVIFGMEKTTPHRHSKIVHGIRVYERKHGLVKNSINTDFFSGHVEIDPFHNLNLIQPIKEWFNDINIVNRMKRGSRLSFDARKEFLDDLAHNMNITKAEYNT